MSRLQLRQKLVLGLFAGFGSLPGHLNSNFRFLALGGIANRSQQPQCLDLAFDQKVLGALLQGQIGQRFVVATGQDNQRDARCSGVHPPHSIQPLRVRESWVEQNKVNVVVRQVMY